MDTNTYLNYVLSMLLRKIVVPADYHGQVKAVRHMLKDDVSGMADSLTDFSVASACVDYSIESDNPKFTKILKKWLYIINKDYHGKVPIGIRPLAKEYFKERWKYSSFPVLKIAKWEEIDGVMLPTKMFFVDGESIYAKEKDKGQELTLLSYDYYLSSKFESRTKLGDNCIFDKPYGRWFDKYPSPYLIKRGVYHNWKIIQSIKAKEIEILDQVIPYMMLVKKGSEALATQNIKTYTDEELNKVKEQFQKLLDEVKTISSSDKPIKSPFRATNFDEDIQHIIPDLANIFKRDLFIVAEKNILAGLGFIDVVEGVSTSRRESVLNPKVFIEEVRTGVDDFKQILKQLVLLIIDKNTQHRKYMNTEFYITSSPVKAFMTDDFKSLIRQMYDRGRISSQTAVELIGEIDFRTEIYRREKETKEGIEETMYPPIKDNREGQGIDLPGDIEKPGDTDEDDIPDDKRDQIERQNYNIGTYESPVECKNCGEIFDMLAEVESHMGAVECPKCGKEVTQNDIITSEDTEIILEEAFKPEITENYVRLRQRDPKEFQKKFFRMINIDSQKGIKAVIGRLKGETTTTVQSFLFDKKRWSVKEAQKWVEKRKATELETAPYQTISDLPPEIKNNMDADLQNTFRRVFNNALKQYGNETRAFRVAWSVIRQIARKGKDGKWHKRKKRVQGKLQKIELSEEIIQKALKEVHEQDLEEAIKQKELENKEKQSKLLDELLNKSKENK